MRRVERLLGTPGELPEAVADVRARIGAVLELVIVEDVVVVRPILRDELEVLALLEDDRLQRAADIE